MYKLFCGHIYLDECPRSGIAVLCNKERINFIETEKQFVKVFASFYNHYQQCATVLVFSKTYT